MRQDCEADIWRKYVAHGVQLIAENTANMGYGKMLSVSFEELIAPKKADNRSADDVINHIKQKIDEMNSKKK
jgi:hypothetical protein